MNVIYASDDNYAWLMGISMISLFENNKECKEINVYLFGDGIVKENEEKLMSIAEKYHRGFQIIDVNELQLPEKLYSTRYPKSAYSRLFAYDLLPKDIEKVLYLDCDIIVVGNLEDLYNRDVDNYAFMAVQDFLSNGYKKKIGIKSSDTYINTGVMLLNLKKFRELPLTERIENFVDKYSAAICHADQDIFNGIFQGEFAVLPPYYNVMTQMNQYSYEQIMRTWHPSDYYSKEEIEFAKQNPRIYHYTACLMDIRPWFNNSKVKNAGVFEKYMRISPWANKEKKQIQFGPTKRMIVKGAGLLPDRGRCFVLRIIHAYMRPYYLYLKTKM